MQNKRKFKFILLVVIIAVLATSAYFIDLESFDRSIIHDRIDAWGVLGIILFMIVYAAGTVAFFPGTPLTVSSGYFFGPIAGTIIAVVSAVVGASGAFFVSKLLGKKYVDKVLHERFKKLDTFDDKLEKNGFLTTLFLRLVPFLPFNGLNFALGLTRVRFKDFFLGTLLGIIPGSYVLANIGANANNVLSAKFGLFIAFFVLLMLVPRLYNIIARKGARFK